MAVTLSLAYTERNDNKVLTLTDISTDWGGANIDVADLTTLTLDVAITTSDNVTNTYAQIDLVVAGALNEFSTQDDLEWQFDASDFVLNGVPMGTSADELPDGIYHFTYMLDFGDTNESILEEDILMEGNVRNAVYEQLRLIPNLYNCSECKSKEILDAIFSYGYLNSMRAGGYVAKTEELISQLYTLERLVEYGSPYSW